MSSSVSSSSSPTAAFLAQAKQYVVPPVAAGAALPIAFKFFMESSNRKVERLVYRVPFWIGFQQGVRTSREVALIVGGQKLLQEALEQGIAGKSKNPTLLDALKSSAVVGVLSAPALAVFNARTLGQSNFRSIVRNLSPAQVAAIAAQETGFVGGISAADKVVELARERLEVGDSGVLERVVIPGFVGAAAGTVTNPPNYFFTCLQAGHPVSYDPRKWMLGATHRARGLAIFTVGYKAAKDALNSVG